MPVSSSEGATRIGVDVGGTFTDLILYDATTGTIRVAKEPTTPAAPENGVISAVASGVPSDVMRRSDYFLHGTTVGLNALLERKGAPVALLATKGFRDVLEMRRGDADEPYNLFWKPPAPLVERRLRLPISERVRADGAIHVQLVDDDVRAAAELLRAEGVEGVAVVFINSYANPAHELRTEELLREAGFTGHVSLSHRVSGEYREYERTCTTVIDAYVRPRTSTYLAHLERDLGAEGFEGNLLVTRCGGGAMTFAEAEARPFETILSGPVAGAEGAAELARALGLDQVITADVGGTSFDTCLITNGRPNVLYQGKVIGLPVQSAWVDVRSIGAGGGSIAYVDVGGLLRVGPQSAGADPGPACYGKGGTQPTVTDAAFVLGMLGEGRLASGIALDVDAARAALAPVTEMLGLEIEQAAQGVITIVNAAMAEAIRGITVEQGQDPRTTTLMPFGGAGPLFGTLLAQELEIEQILIPPYAGNFSAWGLLGSDLTRTAARTRILRLGDEAVASANALLAELFAELEARIGHQPHGVAPTREVAADMRYLGQEHTLTVSLNTSADGAIVDVAAAIRAAFDRDYQTTFAHQMDNEVEIVSVRATMRTELPRRIHNGAGEEGAGGDAVRGTLDAYSFSRGAWLPFDIVDRAALRCGDTFSGPTILVEDTATSYVDAEWSARVDETGSILLTSEVGA